MGRSARAWFALVAMALSLAACGYDVRPKWLRDPEGRKWDSPRPYVGDERAAAAEPAAEPGSTTGHA